MDSTTYRLVRKGARLLDKESRGWALEIDLDIFDFNDPVHCVLGQLFGGKIGSYTLGLRVLGIEGEADRFGFDAAGLDIFAYRGFQTMWEHEIEARQ